ncbi:MAG: hypothetical protein VKL60_19485 [Sphaerospermopsis sp.]|nr:hypothetical protein [Sphaerospermopsis sp.]
MINKIIIPLFLLLISLNSGNAFSQTIKTETPLFDSPDGKSTKNILKEGAEVKVLNRKGFWVQIESAGLKGWVKVGTIKFSDSKVGGVAIDTGRATTGNIVASSASRGLSAIELEKAKPNFDDIALLDAYIPVTENINSFKKDGDLIKLDNINDLASNNKDQRKSVTNADDSRNKGDLDEW